MQSLRTFGGLHCSRTTHKPCFSGQLSGRPSKLNNGSKRIIKTTAFEELRGLGLAAVVDCVRQAGQQLAGMSPPKRVPGRCCVWQQACESAKRLELERIKATIVNALANKQPTQVICLHMHHTAAAKAAACSQTCLATSRRPSFFGMLLHCCIVSPGCGSSTLRL
jgi:hypothetical protein